MKSESLYTQTHALDSHQILQVLCFPYRHSTFSGCKFTDIWRCSQILLFRQDSAEQIELEGKKILNLAINKEELDRILSGEKVQECREVTPGNYRRYLVLDDDGFKVEDEFGNSVVIEYDAIRFTTFDTKEPQTAVVKVRNAYSEMFTDPESGQIITYTHQGLDWVAEQVIYELGEILETGV